MGLRNYQSLPIESSIYYGSNINRTISDSLVRDEYFNYVAMLLHGNGTNTAQNNTFLDSSSNNFTITRSGNTTQGTFSPFGDRWSNYFDGSGDYLQTTAVNISSGNFTIEAWVYLNAMPTSDSWPGSYSNWMEIIGVGTASLADGWQFRIGQTVLAFGTNNDTTAVSATHGMVAGRWYHLTCVKDSSVYSLYVNGLFIGSSVSANLPGTGAFTWIGSETNQGAYLNGYISNLRLVTTALYSSNFTPSTSPLTAITNTILLTCQSNRFRDNSTNNYTITPAGNASVQRFSPFAPTTAYSSTTIGGGITLDGTGDYLTFPSNAAFAMGTGDFTFEAWVYPRYSYGGSTYQTIAGNRSGPVNSATEWTLGFTNAGSVYVYTNGFNIQTANSTVTNEQWYHFALVRSSGTATLYLNGTSAGTANMSGYNFTDTTFAIGANDDGSEPISAILSNCRLLKGTALYTTNFTPPTAPLSNITNTSLLLNGTNAGIIDNASMSNIETIGNAQISTSVKKYGTASISFDGTGDYLIIPNNPGFNLGSGNFTIECWVNFSSNQDSTIIARIVNAGTGDWSFFYNSSLDKWRIVGSSQTIQMSNTWVPTTGVWYHVSVTRSGNDFRFFIDGVQQGTTQTNSVTFSFDTNSTYVGTLRDGTLPLNGYIDDLRITKGIARYTTTFTPSTTEFPDF